MKCVNVSVYLNHYNGAFIGAKLSRYQFPKTTDQFKLSAKKCSSKNWLILICLQSCIAIEI